jgi:hypothetical protein
MPKTRAEGNTLTVGASVGLACPLSAGGESVGPAPYGRGT